HRRLARSSSSPLITEYLWQIGFVSIMLQISARHGTILYFVPLRTLRSREEAGDTHATSRLSKELLGEGKPLAESSGELSVGAGAAGHLARPPIPQGTAVC
ncbi:MAG: hypothetical protein NTU94_10795, partial [Planctomycetota bacterium]|nr:hypothetical protein [Planctomycetota bacterium]